MKKSKFSLTCKCMLSTLMAVFFFYGCSKSGGDTPGNGTDAFLVCKLNGQLHKFNYKVSANQKPAGDIVHAVVLGGWEQENTSLSPGFDITLHINDAAGVKATTYTVAGTNDLELDGQYYIQNVQNGQVTGTTSYSGGRAGGTSFTLTITSLTKWGVKGSFSGQLKNGNETISVTEGAFAAPYN